MFLSQATYQKDKHQRSNQKYLYQNINHNRTRNNPNYQYYSLIYSFQLIYLNRYSPITMRNIFKKTKELSTPLNKWIQDTRGSQDFPLSIQKLNNFYIKYQDIFTKQVSSTIKLESDDDVCSIIANDCYRPKDQRPSTIENFSIVPGLNTEMIAVYENKQSKICIFGLR
ncbi:TPA: hypothetical protein DEP21_00875 [Patescibacteria group bacterium]|nr:hypothetical protein [Candidatus Gracilibacteria bacterium]